MSVAEDSLRFSSLFEAELLVELMLRHWNHPLADDEEFRNNLLEGAVDALKTSVSGQQLLQTVPPEHMNLVAAVWYAESNSLAGEASSAECPQERNAWLQTVRKSVPSCFCDANLLD